jgi:RHS repeat-associated protein
MSTEAVADTDTYDPYGNLIASTGSAQNNLLFSADYMDIESGLYYSLARYYDPLLGQFLSVDPLVAETGAPYSYAVGDPVNEIDPSGDVAVDGNAYGGLATSCGSESGLFGWLTAVPGFASLPGLDRVGAVMQANASAYIGAGGTGVYLRGVASDADVLADVGLRATVLGGAASFAANVVSGESVAESGASAVASTTAGYVVGGAAGAACESTFGVATFGVGTILCAGAGAAVGGAASIAAQDITSWAWSVF